MTNASNEAGESPMRLILATMLTTTLAATGGLSVAWADKPAEKGKPPGPYNKAIVAFCQRQLGKKVGSGECAHLANEALRITGAEFMPEKFGDKPNRGDYVWGTFVKRLAWESSAVVDSSPKTPCQPGDVIQFRDAAFSGGGVSVPHHTAIVAAVDDDGQPTAIYHQNAGNKRFLLKQTIDFNKLTGGWARIYRPSKPKHDRRMPVEFTLLNRTDAAVSYTFAKQPQELSAYDTSKGYRTWRFGGAAYLVVGRSTILPKHRKAYEIYKTKTGQLALREAN
jgi:hypothetical protein